ncbi:MAG TPA: hypothetical protein VFU21_23470 [Kofleriaceae bacterium]|nr:hypothetical protein [Kofleriaceae bacterium]
MPASIPRLEITQTDLAAVADPDEVVLRDELDDELADDSLPAPPRSIRVEEVGATGERHPVPLVVERSAHLAFELPAGAARLVLLALDGDGQVIASRDLEVETAMTAEVFLDLLAAGLDADGKGTVDLHVRLTPELAAALSAAARRQKEDRRPTQKLPSISLATTPRRR